eukprot:366569-Chlamydomonas_euryale.AAC.30
MCATDAREAGPHDQCPLTNGGHVNHFDRLPKDLTEEIVAMAGAWAPQGAPPGEPALSGMHVCRSWRNALRNSPFSMGTLLLAAETQRDFHNPDHPEGRPVPRMARASGAGLTSVLASMLRLAPASMSAPQLEEEVEEALCAACRHGHIQCVRMLLPERSCAARANANRGGEALAFASTYGHADIVELLLASPQHTAWADWRCGYPLVCAAEFGHADVVRLLLHAETHAPRADCQDGEALVWAAENGHAEVLRVLVNVVHHPPRANPRDNVALVRAAARGYMGVVEVLLSAPTNAAQANTQDSLALVFAAQGGHTDVAALLLGAPVHAARADCHGGEALLRAASRGHADVVELLLNAREHAVQPDNRESEALMVAGRNGHARVVVALALSPLKGEVTEARKAAWHVACAKALKLLQARKQEGKAARAPTCCRSRKCMGSMA